MFELQLVPPLITFLKLPGETGEFDDIEILRSIGGGVIREGYNTMVLLPLPL